MFMNDGKCATAGRESRPQVHRWSTSDPVQIYKYTQTICLMIRQRYRVTNDRPHQRVEKKWAINHFPPSREKNGIFIDALRRLCGRWKFR